MKEFRRIKKSAEFQSLIRSKQFAACSSLVLYYGNRQTEISRVGISVGKKIGNAVVRNRCKRQIRMMVQELFDKNDLFDCIIMVRNNYLQYSYEENKKELENIYKKVKIRKYKGE